jgi:hypothetical protein
MTSLSRFYGEKVNLSIIQVSPHAAQSPRRAMSRTLGKGVPAQQGLTEIEKPAASNGPAS